MPEPLANPCPARLRRPARRWLFRAGALLLGLGMISAAEGLCRWLDWGSPDRRTMADPALHSPRPLFLADPKRSVYFTDPARLRFFESQSFPIRKAPGTFRIFCLGGSTVQGSPYGIETAFSTWLALTLQSSAPDRTWEVINCGGISYASYRLVAILRECLAYQPDLILLCTGHNEFLEDRSYYSGRSSPYWLARLRQAVESLHLYGVLRQVRLDMRRPTSRPDEENTGPLPVEVDALLDYQDGLKAYRRDEVRRQRVVQDFALSLTEMLSAAHEARVPVLLIRPPVNLRDCPPFKSEHRADLTLSELARWTALVNQAAALYRTELNSAIELLQEAIKLDELYAETYFALGKCYQSLGQPYPARQAFLQARALDVCPLRISAALENVLSQVVREWDCPWLDAHALLEEQSNWKILGDDWLVDHVHPSILGHQVIADGLWREMIRQGWVSAPDDPGWETARQARYQAHFEALDPLYYLRAEQRLQNLRAWTQGRAGGWPIDLRLQLQGPPPSALPMASSPPGKSMAP